MIAPRKAYDRPHGCPRVLGCGEPSRSQRASHTQHNFHLAAKIWSPGDYRDGTVPGHSSVEQRVPEIFRAFQLRRVEWGLSSCVHYRVSRAPRLSKQAEQHSNKRSVKSIRSFLQSPECFGRTRQRRTSRLRPIVRSVLRNFGSPASVNGPAMPSPRSWLKFSSVTACAMFA